MVEVENKTPNPRFDVAAWTSGIDAFKKRIAKSREDTGWAAPTAIVRLEKADPRLIYSLLVEFISPKPNGFFTVLQQGMPVDNMIWWDFLLACEDHLIAILNGVNGMEAHIFSVPDKFDPERFLLASTSRHRERVTKRAAAYERHLVFVNHYRSYRESLEWLRDEIIPLDVKVPVVRGGIVAAKEAKAEFERIKRFRTTALRFHVLAKSLLTTAAFMCEALISTILRILSLRPLMQDPEKYLFPILRSGFTKKLEVLHAYTIGFKGPIDLTNDAVKKAQQLMELRNKYVHSELSEHVQLPDVYFDEYYPLYGGGIHGQLGAYAQRAYLTPSKEVVLEAVATAFAFDAFIRESLAPKMLSYVEMQLNQSQISYNTEKRIYSVAFSLMPFQSFVSPITSEEAAASRAEKLKEEATSCTNNS